MKTKKRKKLRLKVQYNYILIILLSILLLYLISNINNMNGAFFLYYIDIYFIIRNYISIINKGDQE